MEKFELLSLIFLLCLLVVGVLYVVAKIRQIYLMKQLEKMCALNAFLFAFVQIIGNLYPFVDVDEILKHIAVDKKHSRIVVDPFKIGLSKEEFDEAVKQSCAALAKLKGGDIPDVGDVFTFTDRYDEDSQSETK